jgi:hypothetical protein
MQKVIYSFLLGALIASLVWGFAYLRADSDSQQLIDALRSERNQAIERAESIESELDGAISRVGELEEVNARIKDILNDITTTSGSLGGGVRGYGRINNDFRKYLEENGTRK